MSPDCWPDPPPAHPVVRHVSHAVRRVVGVGHHHVTAHGGAIRRVVAAVGNGCKLGAKSPLKLLAPLAAVAVVAVPLPPVAPPGADAVEPYVLLQPPDSPAPFAAPAYGAPLGSVAAPWTADAGPPAPNVAPPGVPAPIVPAPIVPAPNGPASSFPLVNAPAAPVGTNFVPLIYGNVPSPPVVPPGTQTLPLTLTPPGALNAQVIPEPSARVLLAGAVVLLAWLGVTRRRRAR